MIALVLALSQNRVLGANGELPWGRIERDMKHFQSVTKEGTLIMGRYTFESLGNRPLKGRENIVLSALYMENPSDQSYKVATSLKEAISLASHENIFIIGGSRLYLEGVEIADKIYLTQIHADYKGDVTLPQGWIDYSKWILLNATPHIEDELCMTFLEFTRP